MEKPKVPPKPHWLKHKTVHEIVQEFGTFDTKFARPRDTVSGRFRSYSESYLSEVCEGTPNEEWRTPPRNRKEMRGDLHGIVYYEDDEEDIDSGCEVTGNPDVDSGSEVTTSHQRRSRQGSGADDEDEEDNEVKDLCYSLPSDRFKRSPCNVGRSISTDSGLSSFGWRATYSVFSLKVIALSSSR